MYRRAPILVFVTLLLLAAISAGCGTASKSQAGKIAITTSSEPARQAYLEARDLAERLLAHRSLAQYQKALSLDPDFALAELGLANASPTAVEALGHLKNAVRLADKASEGERLLIHGTEAAFNGNDSLQRACLTKLVAAFPNDERAQFNLGAYYYGIQDFADAITCLTKATELAPAYSQPYNMLGYSCREAGRFPEAETAFKKYIELIPNDPNPYDSQGELYLKMGRFADAIAAYRKAVSLDSNFASSHAGIAMAQLYAGRSADAMAALAHARDIARNDGERRAALYAQMVMDVDGGKWAPALELLDQQYAVAAKTSDIPSMAGDLQNRGRILVEMGRYADARAAFDRSLQLIQDADLTPDIKDNAALGHHYDVATVALGLKQAKVAQAEAAVFLAGAQAKANPALLQQAHSLAGMLALAARDFKGAVAELQQANLRNPYDLYRLALAYQGAGDAVRAKEACTQAARFNSIPILNYAFIRGRAEKALAQMKG